MLSALLFFALPFAALQAFSDTPSPSISETAAMRCNQKLKIIEDFAALEKTDKELTTRFTEEEINSYLILDMASKYKSCLKNLKMAFKQNLLEGFASVDFDCLKETSSKSLPRLIERLFSGTHAITARGTVVSGDGEGSFQLEQVRFDESTLPKFLVEEAITAVCKSQKPPFDPIQPSPLPYNIKKITIHPGYIMVYQ